MSFSKVNINGSKIDHDVFGRELLHVDNFHALIQAVGYVKYKAEPYERIYMRGQHEYYKTLSPSLYRGLSRNATQSKYHATVKDICLNFKENCSIFKQIPEYAHEPILQHYGIKTTWLDIVDNIWVALWFSVFSSCVVGSSGQFMHFERRKDHDGYGYILLISCSDDRRRAAFKGRISSDKDEVVDLRIACPSVFLRPHSQHGLLFRMKGSPDRDLDYSNSIRSVIRYKVSDALEWMGRGYTLDVRALFPPPFYDHGYSLLLGVDHKRHEFGTIHHIGA